MHMPKTLQIKNGEKVTPTFSAQEYANRQAKLRAYMARHGIDAAVFTSYHNINYYSDFCIAPSAVIMGWWSPRTRW